MRSLTSFQAFWFSLGLFLASCAAFPRNEGKFCFALRLLFDYTDLISWLNLLFSLRIVFTALCSNFLIPIQLGAMWDDIDWFHQSRSLIASCSRNLVQGLWVLFLLQMNSGFLFSWCFNFFQESYYWGPLAGFFKLESSGLRSLWLVWHFVFRWRRSCREAVRFPSSDVSMIWMLNSNKNP